MVLLEEPIKEPVMVKNYINGEFVESESEEQLDVINPATQKVIGKVPISLPDELNAAVDAALDAFEEWRKTPPLARARYMFRLKALLEEHFEESARIGVMEHGKTIDEFRGEVRRGIENVEVATGIPSLMMGYNLQDIAVGIDEMVVREPIGVFAIIAPFNFPYMIPFWFWPYAVATGNCVIIKPSSEVPLSQYKVAQLVDEVGFPPGVINFVNGDRRVVKAMLENPNISGYCFVGSTKVGKEVIYVGAAKQGKKAICQCSAKNYLVVMEDCDLERTTSSIMTSFFGNTGQRCLAGGNLAIVTKDDAFYRKVVNAVVEKAKRIVVGYGLDTEVTMGPVRSVDKKERIVGYIEKGIEEGAKLILDGRKPKIKGDYPETCFLGPTIFEDVTPDMVIAKEEIFGPVMPIIRFESLDEAIEAINTKTPYGNAATIYTSNGKYARQFVYEVKCGNIGINIGIVAPMAFFPFGGMKDSFFGDRHGQGRDAIEFFTERKVVITRWW